MLLTDITSTISELATVGLVVYAAFTYHRPKTPSVRPSSAPRSSTASLRPQRNWIPISMAIVAGASVGINWYILRTSQIQMAAPLSSDDARLDVVRIEPVIDEDIKTLLINFYLANNGKSAAIGMRWQGAVVATSDNRHLSPTDLDSVFSLLRLNLISDKVVTTGEIQPGNSSVSFTVPPVLSQNLENYNSYKSSNRLTYGIAMIRYRDKYTDDGTHIYTEYCQIFINKVLHICDGHNQAYRAQ